MSSTREGNAEVVLRDGIARDWEVMDSDSRQQRLQVSVASLVSWGMSQGRPLMQTNWRSAEDLPVAGPPPVRGGGAEMKPETLEVDNGR